MDDFPLLVLFFIIYLIAGSSGRKKSKSKKSRQGPMRSRGQGEQHDVRAEVRDRHTAEGFRTAFSEQKAESERFCAQQSMHLHEVTDDQMLDAAEGEDPCHAGGYNGFAKEMQAESDEEPDEKIQAFRQEVLRGVIMSEILTKPCDRVSMRKERNNGY